MVDTKELLQEMRMEVVWTTVATMPIPLYERMKEAIKQLQTAKEALEYIGKHAEWDLTN